MASTENNQDDKQPAPSAADEEAAPFVAPDEKKRGHAWRKYTILLLAAAAVIAVSGLMGMLYLKTRDVDTASPDAQDVAAVAMEKADVAELRKAAMLAQEQSRRASRDLAMLEFRRRLAAARHALNVSHDSGGAGKLLQQALGSLGSNDALSPDAARRLRGKINADIVALSDYGVRSPRRALTLINAAMELLVSPSETPQHAAAENGGGVLHALVQKLPVSLRSAVTIERRPHRAQADFALLRRLLISARQAVLDNDGEKFNAVVADARRLAGETPDYGAGLRRKLKQLAALDLQWEKPTIGVLPPALLHMQNEGS